MYINKEERLTDERLQDALDTLGAYVDTRELSADDNTALRHVLGILWVELRPYRQKQLAAIRKLLGD